MEKFKLLFIGNVFSYGLEFGAGRTGIFFTAYNVLKELLLRKNVCSVVLYLSNYSEKNIKAISDLFDGEIVDFRGEKDSFSDISCCFSPLDVIPPIIKESPYISCYYMMYDIIPELFPEWFPEGSNQWFEDLIKSIRTSDFVFTISNHTKKDLMAFHPSLLDSHVKCTYISTNREYHSDKSTVAYERLCNLYNFLNGKRYVLSVCSLEPRKNIVRAAIAFIEFAKKNNIKDTIFVLAGEKWPSFDNLLTEDINSEDINSYLFFTGYVPDNYLQTLYSNALWFVYTSEYEGFGMPPLEAMSCGCPVVASTSSSIPEILLDAPLYTEAHDIDGHINAYERIYYDNNLREIKIREGLNVVQRYSWKKCVDSILQTIVRVETRKKNQPLVTVITPTYNLISNNRVNSFKRNIASIKKQTYQFIEHIVVDGGSKDGTVDLIESIRSDYCRAISEPDDGLYYAINKGIQLASGEYIIVLNSDDCFCDEHAIEWLVIKMNEQETSAVCGCARVIDRNGTVVNPNWSSHDTDYLIFGRMACHQTFLISKDVMCKLGLYPTEYKVSADTAFILRMLQNNIEIAKIDNIIIQYSLGGVSSNTEAVNKDVSKAIYEEYGKYHSLTKKDCSLLDAYKFQTISISEQIVLGAKLSLLCNPVLLEEYFVKFYESIQCNGKKETIKIGIKIKESFKKKFRVTKKMLIIKGKQYKIFYLFSKIPFYIKKGV